MMCGCDASKFGGKDLPEQICSVGKWLVEKNFPKFGRKTTMASSMA
jgi:hypothetical protein